MPPASPHLHRPGILSRLLLALGLTFLSGMFPRTAGAAETTSAPARRSEEKKRFDIPAGDAFTTLRRFSVQSGEQLIYQADALEGVRTDPVQGQYTSREALGRMLVRTELAVTQDAGTGTLAITRIPRAGGRNKEDSTPPDQSASVQKKKPRP